MDTFVITFFNWLSQYNNKFFIRKIIWMNWNNHTKIIIKLFNRTLSYNSFLYKWLKPLFIHISIFQLCLLKISFSEPTSLNHVIYTMFYY